MSGSGTPDLAAREDDSLHREDDLFRIAVLFIVEEQAPVDSFVRALFLFRRSRSDEVKRPPLELVRIILRELFRALDGCRFTLNVVGLRNRIRECIPQAAFDQTDREVGDIDAYPVAASLLGGGDRSAAAAEGVKNDSPSQVDSRPGAASSMTTASARRAKSRIAFMSHPTPA